MTYKNTFSLILVMFFVNFSVHSYAGMNGLTHHSRANCLNNETISWDRLEKHNLIVQSGHVHLKTGTAHATGDCDNTQCLWQYTWRDAAVHWGEGIEGEWLVAGHHQTMDGYGNSKEIIWETVTDCSIYDGWWNLT